MSDRDDAPSETFLPGHAFIDAEGFVRSVDAVLCGWLRASPETLVGQSALALLAPEHHESFAVHLVRALEGQPGEGHWSAPMGAAGPSRLRLQLHPLRDADGNVLGVSTVWTDLGPLQRLQAERTALQRDLTGLVEAFPGRLGVADQDLRYRIVNARLAESIGLSRQELAGRRFDEVLPAERSGYLAWVRDQLEDSASFVCDRHYPATADRPAEDVEVTYVAGPRESDGSRRYYLFSSDVTGRRQTEEALIRARNDAQRAAQVKTQFLSHMSHELRTPLNAIMGFAQLIADAPPEAEARTLRAQAQEILRGGRELLQHINDILDLTRVESGRMAVHPSVVDLGPVVSSCIALVMPLCQAQGIAIRHLPPAESLPVLADAIRLRQVLLNLLTNAIKFNRPQGDVEVTLTTTGQGRLRIAVRDEGPGIEPADLKRLFEPFERLDADRQGIPGSGIGLALSRGLLERMDGRIGVDSRPGEGSTFWIELPQLTPHVEPPDSRVPLPAPLPPSAAAARPRTALYIEDNAVNTLLMQAMLARLPDLRVVTAAHPVQGLDLAVSTRPDLVLLDLNLPMIDGYEVLRRLRADARLAHVPVVAVSASALPEEMASARQAGFDAFLGKPLDAAQLIAEVQRLLR